MHFNRRTFCIFCAIAAAIIGLMLALGPLPVMAQDKASGKADDNSASTFTLAFRDDGQLREVEGKLTLLGTGEVLAGFKLRVLAHTRANDGEDHTTADITTDKEGKYLLRLGKSVTRVRLFAYGEYFIPDGVSNVPVGAMKFAKRETWDIHARLLKRVTFEGAIKRENTGKPANRASVYLAPLDVRPDGSEHVFEEPHGVVTDDEGRYRLEVPTGYYRLWAIWSDKETESWESYFGIVRRVDIFAPGKRDFSVALGPKISGSVIDARDGKGLVAWIDLYTNAYLRQLRNPTADGELVDERTPDGREIRWPVGDFNFRVVGVDPQEFTAVVRPRWSNTAMRVIPGLKLADLKDKRVQWKLFTNDQINVGVRVRTHQKDLPVFKLDVRVQAVKLDDPSAIRALYTLGGETDENGRVNFLGLAPGLYTVYGEQGTMILGELRVTRELVQDADFKLEIPFATGTLKYEDGTLCRHAQCVVSAEYPGRGKLGGRFVDPYPTKVLSELGKGLIPLTVKGATFTLRFYANEKGQTVPDDMLTEDFPFVTDEISFTVDTEKAYEYDLTLKPQPKKPPKDPPKDG
ncbi:MAG: hypothetical protein IT462_16230 [Planctomycetes bacterium]|nr:hypothetical protein [Planctomycetota bacterium]